MKSPRRREPDLAQFGDYDAVLSKIGDVQVREPVRRYYRILHYVQQIRSVKWFFFALFITLSIEFQITALLPDHAEYRVFLSLGVAVVVLLVIWAVEHCVFMYGGDPAELFETRDEELALMREIGDMVLDHQPHLRHGVGNDGQSKVGAIFTIPENKPLPKEATTKNVAETAAGNEHARPLVSINKHPPRSSIQLPHGAPAAAVGTVRAGLMHFQSTFSKHPYRVKDK